MVGAVRTPVCTETSESGILGASMVVHQSRKFPIVYAQLPFRRNQDVISVRKGHGDLRYIACVVDGWSNEAFLPGNTAGRRAAEFILRYYPKEFLSLRDNSLSSCAQKAAETIDKELLQKFPAHVASVAAFLFCTKELTKIVSISTIYIFLWDGEKWYKPKEIGDYSLPYPKYPSDAWSFFGRGELKDNSLYTIKADALRTSPTTPILIATDGLDDVMKLEDINILSKQVDVHHPKEFISALVKEIQKRDGQKDDISLLLRGSGSGQ